VAGFCCSAFFPAASSVRSRCLIPSSAKSGPAIGNTTGPRSRRRRPVPGTGPGQLLVADGAAGHARLVFG
jgi:hypothetical protein